MAQELSVFRWRIILPYLALVFVVLARELKLFTTTPSLDPNTTVKNEHAAVAVGGSVSSHPACSHFKTSSMSEMWQNIQGSIILNSTYLPDQPKGNTNTSREEDAIIYDKLMVWTQHLLEYYSPERMRRSIASRPPNPTILKVLTIIADYPTTNVPLKILVTGGSVTAGHWCVENPVGWDGGDGGAPFKECAWPSRLERHLRQLFFNDVNVPGVTVYNMAVGATSVDVATMILEYELLPDDVLSPDVVLLAHSPNDANMLSPDVLFYEHLNNAVQAAKRLRACDDDLPLVGLIDDTVGMSEISKMMETTARYYSIASWYQLMMLDYGNVVRHTLLRRYDENRTEPLMGSTFKVHMGMGFHIGMAWTVVFDFLSIMMEACFDYNEDEIIEPMSLKEWKEEAQLDNLQEEPLKRSPSKHFGGLYHESNPQSVNEEWQSNLNAKEEHCKSFDSSEPPQPVCTYAWMVNKLAGVMRPKDIDNAFSSVMKSSVGWEATGHFYKFPRLGYYAQEANASFVLEIPVTSPTLYFTVLSTESYGPNFIDSNLHIDVEIKRDAESTELDCNTTASYDVEGYHEIETSSHEPHKFRLPGGGANAGDIIFFNAVLTSGSYFKIAGLAFCKQ